MQYYDYSTERCSNGTIRLAGSGYTTMGRVELCINGEWGTICINSFDDNDATVVCRQLGYSTYGKIIALVCFNSTSSCKVILTIECAFSFIAMVNKWLDLPNNITYFAAFSFTFTLLKVLSVTFHTGSFMVAVFLLLYLT